MAIIVKRVTERDRDDTIEILYRGVNSEEEALDIMNGSFKHRRDLATIGVSLEVTREDSLDKRPFMKAMYSHQKHTVILNKRVRGGYTAYSLPDYMRKKRIKRNVRAVIEESRENRRLADIQEKNRTRKLRYGAGFSKREVIQMEKDDFMG